MKRAVTAALALSLLAGSVAMADSPRARNDRDDRGNRVERQLSAKKDNDARRGRSERRDWQNDRRGNDRQYDHRRDTHRYDSRRDDRRWDSRRDRHYGHERHSTGYHSGEYRRPSGYYVRSWRRGDRLPIAYYGRPYRIDHYHGYGLRHPPHGHHWVRVNHDAVLAVIATGIVLDVVYNTFY